MPLLASSSKIRLIVESSDSGSFTVPTRFFLFIP